MFNLYIHRDNVASLIVFEIHLSVALSQFSYGCSLTINVVEISQLLLPVGHYPQVFGHLNPEISVLYANANHLNP